MSSSEGERGGYSSFLFAFISVIRGLFLSGLAIKARARLSRRMRLLIFAAILVTSRLLAGAPPDVEASRLLVGSWDCRGESPALREGAFTFRADGTFSSYGIFHVRNREFRIDVEGKWKVKDGVLVEKLTQSSEPATVPVGLTTRDKVLSITKKKFRFETEQGIQASYVRK
jgi:hypothetical protein